MNKRYRFKYKVNIMYNGIRINEIIEEESVISSDVYELIHSLSANSKEIDILECKEIIDSEKESEKSLNLFSLFTKMFK